jgi:hypothetical protein
MDSQRIEVTPASLCTVTQHTAGCLMAFEEVVAVPPTPKEAESETEGGNLLQCMWRDVARHFFSTWVTKMSRINLFPCSFLSHFEKINKNPLSRIENRMQKKF